MQTEGKEQKKHRVGVKPGFTYETSTCMNITQHMRKRKEEGKSFHTFNNERY
jgi:hypothetical protein